MKLNLNGLLLMGAFLAATNFIVAGEVVSDASARVPKAPKAPIAPRAPKVGGAAKNKTAVDPQAELAAIVAAKASRAGAIEKAIEALDVGAKEREDQADLEHKQRIKMKKEAMFARGHAIADRVSQAALDQLASQELRDYLATLRLEDDLSELEAAA